MTDESYSAEEINTDIGSFSVDDEDQYGSAEDTLEQRGVDDALDEGYSPPEKPVGVDRWGTTAWEQAHDETIDQRIMQEEPDPNTAYGAPKDWGSPRATYDPEQPAPGEEDEADVVTERVGGDDPDSIPAEADFLGDTGMRAGRLVAPDEGTSEDFEKDEVAEDVGIAGGAASAEEAAMHIVADEPGMDDLGADDDGTAEGLTEVTAARIQLDDPTNERDSLRE
jgi:Family of unknown function (DUF5709)